MAMVDALWVCFMQALIVPVRFRMGKGGEHIHIGVGLLHCSFRQDWAMRRPLCVGRATGTDSLRFFRICTEFKRLFLSWLLHPGRLAKHKILRNYEKFL